MARYDVGALQQMTTSTIKINLAPIVAVVAVGLLAHCGGDVRPVGPTDAEPDAGLMVSFPDPLFGGDAASVDGSLDAGSLDAGPEHDLPPVDASNLEPDAANDSASMDSDDVPVQDANVIDQTSDTNALDVGVLDTTNEADLGPPIDFQVAGSLYYLDRPYDADGFLSETRWLPARWVPVELRAESGRTVGQTRTDEEGHFEISANAAGEIQLLAIAEAQQAHFRVTVIRSRWTQHVAALMTSQAELLAIEMDPTDFFIEAEDVAPAFNVVDVAIGGLVFLEERLPQQTTHDLSIRWEDGYEARCGTCYNQGRIELLGSVEDPDGYDDDIVLHEVGHFLTDILSVDNSPGGAHDGTPTDPRLAYSEGFATFFSCWARNSAEYQDYLVVGWKYREHELLKEVYRGTDGGEVWGSVSEILVTSLMWDMVDAANEDHDAMEAEGLFLDAMFGSGEWLDVGAVGVDLADFLLRSYCAADETALEQLKRLVAHTEYPFVYEPGFCP